MGCTVDQWLAKATGSGSDRIITVTGKGECTRGGDKARLERGNDGIVDDPEVLVLRLVVEEAEFGPDVMTPFEVEIEVQGDPAVRVRIDTSEGTEVVEVEEG
jgi:hypothetical protein